MDFLNKVEVIKQYRQSVKKSEKIDFSGSVTQKVQRFKVMTMVSKFMKKIQSFCMRVNTYDLFQNFK